MATDGKIPAQVIAMHGWAGDSRCWRPWIEVTAHLGWSWQCGERGYGNIAPSAPDWSEDELSNGIRVVIGHSLGPHLLSTDVWRLAEIVVLLASFGTFIPPDRTGRRTHTALDGMAAQLATPDQATRMLEKFLVKAASPEPISLMPPSPLESPLNLGRLAADLEILRQCSGLPQGFPSSPRVLIVEAGEDQIVPPAAQAMLREQLPAADVIRLPGAGHALLQTDIISQAVRWVASQK